MFFYTRVHFTDGDYINCAVTSSSEYYAEIKARKYYRQEGYDIDFVVAEIFNSFEHGDPDDYTVI